MTKEEFQHLLQRYKERKCSLEEIQKIDHWFNGIADDSLELNEWEKEQIRLRMLLNIRQPLHAANASSHSQQGKAKPFFSTALKIAASVTIVVLAGYFLISLLAVDSPRELAQTKAAGDLKIEYKNTASSVLKIQLPDASTVELKPNAEISYSSKWDDNKREVHLVGEAFFDVTKDAKRPFFVYGGSVVTKVLGTSFSVNAPKNATTIEVAVRTGKVSVYQDATKQATGVILTPNEKVEYFVQDRHWVTSLIDAPKPLPNINKAEQFIFSGTPLREIADHIKKSYAIDVVVENEASYACTFTGDVSNMELYDMLEIICKSIGAGYETKGTKILIVGSGCK
jgi:transmembrane sensor